MSASHSTNQLSVPPPGPVEWCLVLDSGCRVRWRDPVLAQTWVVARAEVARRLGADPQSLHVERVQ